MWCATCGEKTSAAMGVCPHCGSLTKPSNSSTGLVQRRTDRPSVTVSASLLSGQSSSTVPSQHIKWPARLRGSSWSAKPTDQPTTTGSMPSDISKSPSGSRLADACRVYLAEHHTILWADFNLADPLRFDQAVEWLEQQVRGVLRETLMK